MTARKPRRRRVKLHAIAPPPATIEEWDQLGANVLELNPERFAEMVGAVREVLGTQRRLEAVYTMLAKPVTIGPEPVRVSGWGRTEKARA